MDSIVTPKLGVLFNTDRLSGPDLIEYATRIEAAGIDSVWLAELFGREPFVAAATLLAHTDVLSVGTAIANIYARDATATAAAAATLAEVSNNRFQLGLGVSNRGLIEMRGHTWEPPVELLSTYLDQARDAKIDVPPHDYPVWVAAHGPKMLGAASSRADGVFTYLMNSAHTARTAATLAGPRQRRRRLPHDDVSPVPGPDRGSPACPESRRLLYEPRLLPPGMALARLRRR